jgi:hypothetical protein
MAESGKDISGLGFEELKALLVQALEQNARLKTENAELREEIARLKGLKGRPKLKPSGMDKAAEAGAAKGGRKKGRRGAKRAKLSINETRIGKPDNPPAGARFKGYEDFIVQDIVIKPWTVLYRRERWRLPSGETVVTALPQSVTSHFGPEDQALHPKPAPPGASDRPAPAYPAARLGHRYLQAADRAAAQRQAGRLPRRSQGGAARGSLLCLLDHGR